VLPDPHRGPDGPPDDESARVGEIVARLTDTDRTPDRRSSGRAMRSLTTSLASSARAAGHSSVLRGRWLTDLVVETAPRIPLRDAATLRAHHPGRSDEQVADALVTAAARATGTVGAAGGALAAVEFAAPPTLLTAPAQLAAETVLVAAVEMKLIAELHEVYGAGVAGTPRQRAAAYLVAWTNRRGLDPLDPAGMQLALGGAAKRALRRRLVRRAGRNLSTLGPLMSGAVAGSVVNFRETRRLGEEVREDLRRARR
jgi:hypothetical protein